MSIIFISLSIGDLAHHAVSHSNEEIRRLNDSFVDNIERLDPLRLAKVFYGYLRGGTPPIVVNFHGVPVELPEKENIFVATFNQIRSGGPVTWVIAMIVVLIGALVLRAFDARNPFLYILLAPCIGGGLVWVLLKIMYLSGFLFGKLLDASELNAGTSVIGAVLFTSLKEREHFIISKLIERLAGKH